MPRTAKMKFLNLLDRLNLRPLLLTSFGAIVAIGLSMAVVTSVRLGSLTEASLHMAGPELDSVSMMQDINTKIGHQSRLLREYMLQGEDPAEQRRTMEQVVQLRAEITKMEEALTPLVSGTRIGELLARLHTMRRDAAAVTARVMELYKAGSRSEAIALLIGDHHKLLNEMFKLLDQMVAAQLKHARHEAAENAASARRSTITVYVMTAFLGLIGTLTAFGVSRGLRRQLGAEPREIKAGLARVAQGDLRSPRVPGYCRPDSAMGQLSSMVTALNEVVRRVRQDAEHVSATSRTLAAGSVDLSGRTEQQAAALEQTSATMEELGATVRGNANNAEVVSQLADSASASAANGGEVVRDMVSTMHQIDESSQRIANIIGVIDGIAFQTNILALNAAVEAARAGEQGRGFAVVAGEVRTLAQRSASAAREVKSLIDASVERVAHGNTLAEKAGATMDTVVREIRRVTDMVGEISAASKEQSNGVSQVVMAVQQMDRAVQDNAALVVQSRSAAMELDSEAGSLMKSVATFRLD